jgi:hypothetical protein
MDFKDMLKEKAEEIIEKIKTDKAIAAKWQKDPISTVEELVGIGLPNAQVEALVDLIKAKIDMDKIGNALGGLKGLFGK